MYAINGILGGSRMKKKVLRILLTLTLMLIMSGCGDSEEKKGSVYYLNFKPEVASVWEEIAQA